MEDILQTVEKIMQDKPLASIHLFVFYQSWLGKTYDEMSKASGYCSHYLKEIGSQLWQELSVALGKRITKKNLHVVFKKHLQDNIGDDRKLNFTTEYSLKMVVPDSSFNKIDYPSGPVPLDSALYINRPPLEELICQEILHSGCLIRIKAPRKMGKSSLLNRMIAFAKEQNYQ
nr:AAA-like domain-containing protein [Nostoc sp. DedSLP05]MDZ8102917.1 AAA-like domain-containing protein [Nostoc sp. DedSLP01]